jgi:pyruvate/2-oxoacid:ferredoxin oxidoreductase alpha subunit
MEIADFIRHRDVIIVPEMNYTGQFARMIQAEYWREVVSLRKYGGVPFSTREVYEEIKRVYAAVNATPRTRSIAKRSAPVKRVAPKAKKVMPKKKTARRK